MQQVLDARSSPAPRAIGQPCRDHHWAQSPKASLCQESPRTSSHQFPRRGSRDLKDPWKEGGGSPEWRTEEQGARRAWGRKEEDLGDESKLSQESRENPSLQGDVGALEGRQIENRASETQASVSCPWPRPKLPLPLLQGEASVSTEGPKPLSRRGREGGLSSEEEEEHPTARARGAQRPSPAGAQLLAGQGKEETLVWSAKALHLQEESPGDEGQEEKEEEASLLEGSSLGHGDVPEEPGPSECVGQDMLFSVAEEGLMLCPRLAFPPKGTEPSSDPWALSKGPGSSELRLDEFEKEMEACFQQLSILELGCGGRWPQASTLVGESRSLAWKWPSCQGKAYSRQALGNEGLDICSAREVKPRETSEEVKPGEMEALGTSAVLPGTVPDLDDVSLGPEWPAELGQNQPLRALERQRRRFHQLISGLKKERSQVLHDNAELRGDQEKYLRKLHILEKERGRNGTKIATLQRENSMLLGDISHLKGELDQCRQVISDLEDCNGKSYSKISELEEENEKLKRHVAQLQRATWESLRKSKGVMERVTLGNQELKALISELGVGYKELMKGVALGIEDMVQAFRGGECPPSAQDPCPGDRSRVGGEHHGGPCGESRGGSTGGKQDAGGQGERCGKGGAGDSSLRATDLKSPRAALGGEIRSDGHMDGTFLRYGEFQIRCQFCRSVLCRGKCRSVQCLARKYQCSRSKRITFGRGRGKTRVFCGPRASSDDCEQWPPGRLITHSCFLSILLASRLLTTPFPQVRGRYLTIPT